MRRSARSSADARLPPWSKDGPQERAEYLAKMLGRNRRIGTATGILMARRRWSESQAFEAMAFEAIWRYARDSTTHTVRAPSGSGWWEVPGRSGPLLRIGGGHPLGMTVSTRSM
jgi:hypothetical protein